MPAATLFHFLTVEQCWHCISEKMSANPYLNYYSSQAGSGLSFFSGSRYQRGHGLGSFLSSLFRTALLPGLKSAGRYAAKEALHTGKDLIGDIIGGENVKDAAKKRVKEAGARALNAASNKLLQSGTGRHRKYKAKSNSKKSQTRRKRTVHGASSLKGTQNTKLLTALNKALG